MRVLTAILGSCLVALAACGGNDDDLGDDTIKRAQVRVVQAVVDAPVLDVYVTTAARLPAFPRVASGAGTGRVGLDQDANYQFIARVPGDPTILAQLDIRLPAQARQLILVSGAINPGPGEQPITITAFNDDRIDPGAGKTLLRVVNATLTGTTVDASLVDLRPDGTGRLVETTVAFAGLAYVGGVDTEVAANRPLPVAVAITRSAEPLVVETTQFTVPALPPASDVTIVVIGSTEPEVDGVRTLRLLAVPEVSPANTTPLTSVQQNPFAVFVNGVPGSEPSLVVDGTALEVPYSTVSPLIQVPTALSATLGTQTASLDGALDPASTYLVVLARDPLGGGITMYAYRDVLADSVETRVRAINATAGAGARDIMFDPAPVLGTDLVVGAASSGAGTLITDPAAITAVLATRAAATTLTYTTSITAAARYVVLIGDAAADHGAVIVNQDWSASFVAAD